MDYFKVGCRWSPEGRKETNIEDVFQKYQAIFIDKKRDNGSLNCMHRANKGDRVAIADGKKIIGVAIITSDKMSLKDMAIPSKKQFNEQGKFSHKEHILLDNVFGFKASVMLFKKTSDKIIDDEIDYGNIGAFRHVVKQDVRDHIDAMCKKYKKKIKQPLIELLIYLLFIYYLYEVIL